MKKFFAWLIAILAIAAIIAVTQIPVGESEVNEDEEETVMEDLEKFVGAYQDEFSQRASADVSLNEDKESLKMRVHWSDSAWSGVIWEMDLTKDGDKLVYTNGVKDYYQFTSETEPETYTRMDENQSGYFEIKDDKLYWLGSPEDDCKECIFSLPDYPEVTE